MKRAAGGDIADAGHVTRWSCGPRLPVCAAGNEFMALAWQPPFDTGPCVRCRNEAQFHTLKNVAGLAHVSPLNPPLAS